jgi:TPR repeat protein
MYRIGNGVKEKDESEAVKWFNKAAEQGFADAQHNLGYMYYNGCGVEKDVDEAVEWLNKAAAQGHSGAKDALKMILGA